MEDLTPNPKDLDPIETASREPASTTVQTSSVSATSVC